MNGACRELDTLRWLANELSSEQQALTSTLAKLSSRLDTQLPSSSSSSSSSTAGLELFNMQSMQMQNTAGPQDQATTADLEGLVTQLCKTGSSLRQGITDAADALSTARSSLQQLAAAHDPHASGVGQLQQLAAEKQQQLQENQAGLEDLTKQVWRL
jgi:chromosome segregation ATPase